MEKEKDNDKVLVRGVVDLLTVAAHFCKVLEQCGDMERTQFIDMMRTLLPAIYLKASCMMEVPETPGFNEPRVTEEDYNFVRGNVAAVMRDMDDYLDVFVEDFKYSDRPVLRTVSEDLADIYQELRDFIEVVRGGHDEAISVALYEVRDHFETSWGQKVLNALRALHDVRFGGRNEE